MDFQRAQQIINSPETIQVIYKDKSVWLENLDQSTNTALVSTGDEFKKQMTVKINELEEAH